VFVNGKKAGEHSGAYTAFTLDITDLLKPGENYLQIKVTNPLEKGIGPRGKQTLTPNSMWYTASSGIWQTVWLEKVPRNYIKSLKITPDIDHSRIHILVVAARACKVTIKTAGETVSGVTNTEIIVPVKNPRLWSPDEPYLYDASIILGNDEVKSYFGMRKIEIKKDEQGMDRIFLNNKYTYNLGTLDQGFWPDGLYTAPTDEALAFDIKAIKAMGFNTIRKHIKVESARWYYHADKLGVLVWQDLVQPSVKPGWPLSQEAKAEFEKESVETLNQLRNYPSIVTWVLFNEGWGEYDQERLAKWVKISDPTRLLDGHSGAAIVGGHVNEGAVKDIEWRSVSSDMTDVHSYPPPTIPNYIAGKAMVLGEFGGIGVPVEGHVWDDVETAFSYGKTVSGGTMRRLYKVMVDSLIGLQKKGLSASIYTQPYDVESEQNGIMTYDRERTKIPFSVLRDINGRLWPATKNTDYDHDELTISPSDTAAIDFEKRLTLFKNGKRDSAFLRSLTILASAKNDGQLVANLSDAYIDQLYDPLVESNLRFIKRFLSNSTNKAFPIIRTNKQKVDAILGDGEQAKILTEVIYKESIAPRLKDNLNPDWATMEKDVTNRYRDLSDLALEKLFQARMIYAFNRLHDWNQVAAICDRWFNMKQPALLDADGLNLVAWAVFSNLEDSLVLKKALVWSNKSMELDPDRATWYMDTYANILYKLGRINEALIWEKKAVNGNPYDDQIKNNYQKMQNGERTWKLKNAL
jgi:tetratricopeptide (TPR) repeat protein